MPKVTATAPADKVALYEKLVATNPSVKRKGAMMPYTSLNGNMFSLLNKEGVLLLRLSDEQRTAFIEKFKTKPVVMYGAVMPEYVAVPDELLAKTGAAQEVFRSERRLCLFAPRQADDKGEKNSEEEVSRVSAR